MERLFQIAAWAFAMQLNRGNSIKLLLHDGIGMWCVVCGEPTQ